MKLTDAIKQLKEIFKRDGESEIAITVLRADGVLIDDAGGLDAVSIGDAARMLAKAHKASAGAVSMDVTINESDKPLTQGPDLGLPPAAQGKRRRGNGDDTRKSRN